MKQLHYVLLALFAALLLGSVACIPGGMPPECDDFESSGGSSYTTYTTSGCRLAVPTSGSSNPIITWGNGTSGSPSTYTGLLNRWASHGMITTASTSGSTGTGYQMRQCLSNATSLTSSNLFGAAGHSQGGGGTLCAAEDDSRIDATALVMPDIVYTSSCDARDQTADMLYLCGSSDTLAPCYTNGEYIWSQSDVPTFWAERSGVSHMEPTGSGTNDFTCITTAWFTYKLKPGSSLWDEAASLFQGSYCGFCTESGWDVRRKYNP